MSVNYPSYQRIVQARVDRRGDLRLYRRRRLVGVRQVAFHPAGEWAAAIVEPDGKATVSVLA